MSPDEPRGSAKTSPRDYMRNRRPERFSDSQRVKSSQWSRGPLEYHLTTLTSRSQESQFERFAIQLLKKTVCPNLAPQAGPMGGGDGKIDSDTYVVADSLALFWMVTDEVLAGAKEKWAVAVSAKEEWKSKIKDDIQKIAKTKRGYRKAFFVSNQYIPAKDKNSVQDELTKKHKIDVTIFDREWILDKVLSDHLEHLFTDFLGYEPSEAIGTKIGPNDAERIKALEENRSRIEKLREGGHHGPEIASLALDNAILIRGLERSRTEVDAAFALALRIANKEGGKESVRDCHYNMAWTSAWWHEDWHSFLESYTAYRKGLKKFSAFSNVERLHNLWQILVTQVRSGNMAFAKKNLKPETKILRRLLGEIAGNEGLPNASLSARTTLAFMDLIEDHSRAPKALSDIRACINEAGGKIGYSVSQTLELISELERVFGDLNEYASLHEDLLTVSGERLQSEEKAKLLLHRAAGLTDREKTHQALVVAARAIDSLKGSEHPRMLSFAFHMLSSMYAKLGLPWAERSACLNAFGVSLTDGWSISNATQRQAKIIRSLKWNEIFRGWLAHAMECHIVEYNIAKSLKADHAVGSEYLQDRMLFDSAMAIQVLRADQTVLGRLTQVPDFFDQCDLFFAASATRHALGHSPELPSELGQDEDWFAKILTQPMAQQITWPAIIPGSSPITIVSKIGGCRISVVSDSSADLVMIAKSCSGFLESLMATSILRGIAPRTPVLTIEIKWKESTSPSVKYNVDMTQSEPTIVITIESALGDIANAALQMGKKLHEGCLVAVAHAFLIDGLDAKFRVMADQESGFARAVDASGSIRAELQLYGHSGDDLQLLKKRQVKTYPIRTTKTASKAVSQDVTKVASPLKPGEGEPSRDLDFEMTRHDDITMPPIIRPHLWDAAKWMGTGFVGDRNGSMIPLMVLAFSKPEKVGMLWESLLDDVAKCGFDRPLRISIVRGISRKNPHAYRVAVMPGEEWFRASGSRLAIMPARINTMEPKDPSNLQRFLDHYGRHGKLLLYPGILKQEGLGIVSEAHIKVDGLAVRDAYQIGPNDFDAMAIRRGDDVIIPVGISNAPVLELMKSAHFKERTATVGIDD